MIAAAGSRGWACLAFVGIATCHSFADVARAAPAFTSPESFAVAAARPEDPASDTSASDPGLQATAAPAWVPDRPVPAQEPWELALRAPERIAPFPLSLLGRGTKWTLRLVEQDQLLPRLTSRPGGLLALPFGFSVGAAQLGPRVGLGLAARFE